MNWLVFIVIGLAVALVLFQYWIYVSKKSRWAPRDIKFCNDNWRRIAEMNDIRHQVVEADKLLDHMMRKRGMQGSVGDMLKQNGSRFSDLEGLWQAHKLRNKLAHELDYGLSAGAAKTALGAFKRALKDLGLDL